MKAPVKAFTNAETARQYKMLKDNWNRFVFIPKVWKGKICDMPPHAAKAYIESGRTDVVAIEVNNTRKGKEGNTEAATLAGENAGTK